MKKNVLKQKRAEQFQRMLHNTKIEEEVVNGNIPEVSDKDYDTPESGNDSINTKADEVVIEIKPKRTRGKK